jgi:hypothetical protein
MLLSIHEGLKSRHEVVIISRLRNDVTANAGITLLLEKCARFEVLKGG